MKTQNKELKKIYDHEYYLKHKEYILRYYKQWREANKDKLNEYFRWYYGDPKNKQIRKCRNTVNRMIKNGLIKRKNCCECGKKAEAHHEDYSKPLEIIWLCKDHHEQKHSQFNLKI